MKSHKSGSHSFRFKIALIKATNRAAIISLTQKKKIYHNFCEMISRKTKIVK